MAYQDCDLWGSLLLSSILFNLNFGPFDGSKWWREIQSAAASHRSKYTPFTCPLFPSTLPAVARDRGMFHRLHDPLWQQEVSSC